MYTNMLNPFREISPRHCEGLKIYDQYKIISDYDYTGHNSCFQESSQIELTSSRTVK